MPIWIIMFGLILMKSLQTSASVMTCGGVAYWISLLMFIVLCLVTIIVNSNYALWEY